jgi:hypothetical protein
MEKQLVNRYAVNMHAVLSCYDRILITGTLPGVCYTGGITRFLYSQGVRIFDYAQFAEPLRERIRTRAFEVCEAMWWLMRAFPWSSARPAILASGVNRGL